jgi:hypothetical protein
MPPLLDPLNEGAGRLVVHTGAGAVTEAKIPSDGDVECVPEAWDQLGFGQGDIPIGEVDLFHAFAFRVPINGR